MKGAYATKGNQWVSYNDVQFVKEKADYVIKNKYGGVAVFTMDMDDFNNNCCQVRFLEFTVRRKQEIYVLTGFCPQPITKSMLVKAKYVFKRCHQ